MKKHILILFAAVLVLAACENENDLFPADPPVYDDWSLDLDMSNPLVKEFYEDYGIGILTDFNVDRDMLYNISSYWSQLSLKKFDDDREIQRAFEFLQESFLVYFTNKDFIKGFFPRKILLSSDIYLNDLYNNICPACGESDYNVGLNSEATGSQHSIYNKGSFAFSVKLSVIYADEWVYEEYLKDNLYIFIANLLERNNLYDEFGNDFFLPEMENCYKRPFHGDGSAVGAISSGVWLDDNPTYANVVYANKYWLWLKGFVSTRFLNPVVYPNLSGEEKEEIDDPFNYGYEDDGGRIRLKDAQNESAYTFPSRELSLRMVVNQMIFVQQDVWDKYPDVIKNRFAILMDKFDEWGIDIRSINPVMDAAFPRQ